MSEYIKKKNELLRSCKSLLEEESILYRKALQTSQLMNELIKCEKTPYEDIDVIMLTSEEDIEKLTRLVISLLYVENPDDKEVVEHLLGDIHLRMEETMEKETLGK